MKRARRKIKHLKKAKVCQITGKTAKMGGRIHRRGLAKKSGGIGMHVTKHVKRKIYPNLHTKRIFVPELDKWLKLTISSRALKTINKNGALETLTKAGILKEGRDY